MANLREFTSVNGFTIIVGKSSRDNDYLTLKIANKEDIFFHASDFPGSHVILRFKNSEPSREDLLDAACLAAHFSKGSDKKVVKVDYTPKKYVHKPRKSPSGTVELEKFKTLKIKKSENRINKFIKK